MTQISNSLVPTSRGINTPSLIIGIILMEPNNYITYRNSQSVATLTTRELDKVRVVISKPVLI